MWSWKVWSGAYGDEGGWDLGDGGAGGTSDTSRTSGTTGVGINGSTDDSDFDWFSVGTAGDDAPGPVSGPVITSVSGDNVWADSDTAIPIVGTGFV